MRRLPWPSETGEKVADGATALQSQKCKKIANFEDASAPVFYFKFNKLSD